MLILHTLHGTTRPLSSLFNVKEDRIVDLKSNPTKLKAAIAHCPTDEYIVLLGCGNKQGLQCPSDDTYSCPEFIPFGPEEIELLRNHGNKVIGIWQDARSFARKHRLSGLFTGRLITNREQAESYGIITLQHIIEEYNEILFRLLRQLLDEGQGVSGIPARLEKLYLSRTGTLSFNSDTFRYISSARK